jgi:hypothetical protein
MAFILFRKNKDNLAKLGLDGKENEGYNHMFVTVSTSFIRIVKDIPIGYEDDYKIIESFHVDPLDRNKSIPEWKQKFIIDTHFNDI